MMSSRLVGDLPASHTLFSIFSTRQFGGKKFKIEIDSAIWREEIQNRNRTSRFWREEIQNRNRLLDFGGKQ